MKKIIYFISGILGWIIAFGAGIGVAVTSKVFAQFKDSDSLKEAVKEADEAINAMAEEKLSKETEEVTEI